MTQKVCFAKNARFYASNTLEKGSELRSNFNKKKKDKRTYNDLQNTTQKSKVTKPT